MAGPGGGPPRKSHTKSRTGCQTCKRRHIRCDETFPQCQNCTKHTCRCDYMDAPVAASNRNRHSEEINVLWTPEIERNIQRWRQTKLLPCSNSILISDATASKLSPVDLRLLYHIAAVTAQLQALNAAELLTWAPKIPSLLLLADRYDFVMHAVLAFSATHLGWITSCKATDNLAFYHQSVALRGLQQVLPIFSRQNSDAILGASLLLSWLSNNIDGWTSLARGSAKVIDAMQSWCHESQFSDVFDQLAPFGHLDLHSGYGYDQEDIASIQSLASGLMDIQSSVAMSPQTSAKIVDLGRFLTALPARVSVASAADRFEFLQQIRRWVLWLPVSLLQATEDPGALTVLAYFYGTALAVEPFFPAAGCAGLSRLVFNPLRQIAHALYSLQTHPMVCSEANVAIRLLDLPLQIAKRSQRRGFSTYEKPTLYMEPHSYSPPFASSMAYHSSPIIAEDQQEPYATSIYNYSPCEVGSYQY